MRKLFFWLLLPVLAACSESASDPVIVVESLCLNDDETNYVRQTASIPALAQNDEVTLVLRLQGNGEHLNTFIVQEAKQENALTALALEFVEIDEDAVSQDKDFTDKAKGQLGFKDGVSQSCLTVKATVRRLTSEQVTVNFYLFSKAVDCEGAKYELVLPIQKE